MTTIDSARHLTASAAAALKLPSVKSATLGLERSC